MIDLQSQMALATKSIDTVMQRNNAALVANLDGITWFFDHAEPVSDHNLERIARLGGGVAVQHRIVYQGKDFLARNGAAAAEPTPPIARMLTMGIPLSAGTDATRGATIITELVGSALVIAGRLQWLGTLWLARFTLIASLLANAFWTPPPGTGRCMAARAFSKYRCLIGGFLLVTLWDSRGQRR